WFGYSLLFAVSAGSLVLIEPGGRTLLAPLVLRKDQEDLKQLALSGRDIRALDWQSIPRRAFWVHWRWWGVIGLAAGAGAGYKWGIPLGAAVAVSIMALTALSQTMAVRRSAYAMNDELVASRQGWLLHQMEYLPLARVQAVSIDTSPFQRRLRLATVTLTSAAVSPSGRTVILRDMEEQEAEELAERVFRLSQEQAREDKSDV
ncbi:MAG: PH domain-containing protein, partial [Fimbriimonadaceae bacterium]